MNESKRKYNAAVRATCYKKMKQFEIKASCKKDCDRIVLIAILTMVVFVALMWTAYHLHVTRIIKYG